MTSTRSTKEERRREIIEAATREFANHIFNVHLKDTEILWPIVRKGGIQPLDNAKPDFRS